MKRGIIASPGIITPLAGSFRMERSLSAEELRYFILYWDEIVIPGNNLVYIGVPGEEELIKCGAISRPRIAFQGSFQGDQVTNAILGCQGIVAEQLVKRTDTDWVIHQIGTTLSVLRNFSERRNMLRIVLAEALPVPSPDIPVAELLEFKSRRRDQLVEMHEALDAVYQEVLAAPDSDLAARKAISQLKRTIESVNTVTAKELRSEKKYSISVQFNLDGARATPAIGAGALFDLFTNGLTIPIGIVGSALLSTLKIKSAVEYTFSPAHENKKLAYISSASAEGLIGKRA
jgi:hypothetical protein